MVEASSGLWLDACGAHWDVKQTHVRARTQPVNDVVNDVS